MFRDYVLMKRNHLNTVYAANRPFSLRHHLPKAIEYIQEFFTGAVKNTFMPKI